MLSKGTESFKNHTLDDSQENLVTCCGIIYTIIVY